MKTPRISPKQAIRAALWLGPGFWAFVLDFLLFWGLVLIWNQHRLVSFTLAFLLSCTFRFFLDRRYTYKPVKRQHEDAASPTGAPQSAGPEPVQPVQPVQGVTGWQHASQRAKETTKQFLRYILACCLSMLVGMLAFYWGSYLGFGPLLSKVFSIPFTSGASELLFRFAVFR